MLGMPLQISYKQGIIIITVVTDLKVLKEVIMIQVDNPETVVQTWFSLAAVISLMDKTQGNLPTPTAWA